MMALLLQQVWEVSQGDVEDGAIDCTPYLDAGETVTGTPTVSDVDSTGDLTFGSEAASTAELSILGSTVAIGKAVQFSFQGQQSGTTYRLRVTFSTSAGRTKVVDQRVQCV